MTNDERISRREAGRVFAGYVAGCLMAVASSLATSAVFTNFWVAYNPALRGYPEMIIVAAIAAGCIGLVALFDAFKEESWLIQTAQKLWNIFEARDADTAD